MDIVLSIGFAAYANRGTAAADPSNTINRVEPLIPPELAVICGLPIAPPVACPVLPMLASAVSELLQAALLVKSAVLPSLNVPVALNCTLLLMVTLGFPGVTTIETGDRAAVTVSIVEPVTPPVVALMVVDPAFRAVPKPVELMFATVPSDEAHVTPPVVSVGLFPLNATIAVNCCVPPAVTVGLSGVTCTDVTLNQSVPQPAATNAPIPSAIQSPKERAPRQFRCTKPHLHTPLRVIPGDIGEASPSLAPVQATFCDMPPPVVPCHLLPAGKAGLFRQPKIRHSRRRSSDYAPPLHLICTSVRLWLINFCDI